MAALAEAHGFELVDLRHVDARRLEPLLDEETAAWDSRLHWDFRPSSSLILHHARMRALDGLVLLAAGEVAGLSYWVSEGRKALIGDLFVNGRWRSHETETYLLRGVLAALRDLPDYTGAFTFGGTLRISSSQRPSWINRIEAQFLQIVTPAAQLALDEPGIAIYPRLFMLAPTDAHAPRAVAPPDLRFERWSMRWMDDAAALIASVYDGHIDADINDQYRSVDGARRFMQNIVQYPGCGVFQYECSWIALTPDSQPVGLILATRLSASSGHIAQICVDSAWRGTGAAPMLMRLALDALRAAGMTEASLTVTEVNTRAIALYRSFGFHDTQRFDAIVWTSAA